MVGDAVLGTVGPTHSGPPAIDSGFRALGDALPSPWGTLVVTIGDEVNGATLEFLGCVLANVLSGVVTTEAGDTREPDPRGLSSVGVGTVLGVDGAVLVHKSTQ